MSTKKSAKTEEIAVTAATIAAKPLRKASSDKPVKSASKQVKPESVEAVKTVKPPKVKAVKEKTIKKQKVVRDSFTMPQSEYQKIDNIKVLCLKASLPVKKSEVLRAGLKALCAMDETQLKNALNGLDKIKTGRPNKH